MGNRVVVHETYVSSNRIDYNYSVEGDWAIAFHLNEPFFIEYGDDISAVPESVAVVPLLANLLPMAWVYDAEIVAPVCDRDFFDSVEEFKKGFVDMYPMMELRGKLTVDALEENRPSGQSGAAAFYSGGVDALDTLIRHAEEKPTLLTVWGIDVAFEDTAGWERMKALIAQAVDAFDVECVTIKSCLRRFIDKYELGKKIAVTGDQWWHGFQHGLGTYSHAAPVAYARKIKSVYFASTFTTAEKGKQTCASDPTIDNFVRFCGARVVHDGYDSERQMKVHNIAQCSQRMNRNFQLHVCWAADGGSNCCLCEKCRRTLLAIFAENRDPNDFGLVHSEEQLRSLSKKMRYGIIKKNAIPYYRPIRDAMRKNCRPKDLPRSIRWFYSTDVSKLSQDTPTKKARRYAKRVRRKVFSILKIPRNEKAVPSQRA